MPKESFEQFVKRQEEKLDEVEEKIGEIKDRWKDKIKEGERLSKELSEKIEEVFEERKKKLGEMMNSENMVAFIQEKILPEIPRIPSFLLEKTLQKLIERYEKREYSPLYFSLLLSTLINRTIEEYIESQRKKGKKFEEIKPLEIHLDLERLPENLQCFGYRNQEKSHLFIKEGIQMGLGDSMIGGKIIIEGNAGYELGSFMTGGEIIVKGNTEGSTGLDMAGGRIIVEGDAKDLLGDSMTGGKIIIEGNARNWVGRYMKNGILEIKGDVESFHKTAFSPDNLGTIIWKGIKIWENGSWTKEGKEMWEKGEIPVE